MKFGDKTIEPGTVIRVKNETFIAVVKESKGNDLVVDVISTVSGMWQEVWNLEHTISALETGLYRLTGSLYPRPISYDQYSKMTLKHKAQRLIELRSEIMDLANSLAGDDTGSIAALTHEAANWLNTARGHLNTRIAEGSTPDAAEDEAMACYLRRNPHAIYLKR